MAQILTCGGSGGTGKAWRGPGLDASPAGTLAPCPLGCIFCVKPGGPGKAPWEDQGAWEPLGGAAPPPPQAGLVALLAEEDGGGPAPSWLRPRPTRAPGRRHS